MDELAFRKRTQCNYLTFGGCSAQKCNLVWKEIVCAQTYRSFFCDRNGRRRDTERYTGIHWDTRVSRCIPVYPLTRRHRDTLGYTCIPMYPGVSPHQDTQGYIGIHVYPNVSWCIPVCLLRPPYHQVFLSMADT